MKVNHLCFAKSVSLCVQFEGSAEHNNSLDRGEAEQLVSTSMLNMQEKQSMNEKVIGKSSNKEDTNAQRADSHQG